MLCVTGPNQLNSVTNITVHADTEISMMYMYILNKILFKGTYSGLYITLSIFDFLK